MISKYFVLAIVAIGLTACSENHEPKTQQEQTPHVFPDASAQEIMAYMAAEPEIATSAETIKAADDLKDVIDMGQRVYAWLDVVNAKRAADQKLSFSNKENVKAYPIEAPKIYNAELIRAEHKDAVAKTPKAMLAVLQAKTALPETLPVSDKEFLEAGLLVSSAYDGAARWIMMQNYLPSLRQDQVNDVRGYVYFMKVKDVENLLENFKSQSEQTKADIREALTQMCLNNQAYGSYRKWCADSVATAEKNDNLFNNYKRNLMRAQYKYENYFNLDRWLMRDDIEWTSKDSKTLHYPFLQPAEANITAYLRDNIEDEFKMAGFQLKLDFTTMDSEGLSRLEYQTGVTPHAFKGRIVMDKNEPITEWSSQWTIRHEFGHLLGFTDCYVEFYDDSKDAIVNYQLDVTDIMCSRRGVFQKHHYDRLKAAYYK